MSLTSFGVMVASEVNVDTEAGPSRIPYDPVSPAIEENVSSSAGPSLRRQRRRRHHHRHYDPSPSSYSTRSSTPLTADPTLIPNSDPYKPPPRRPPRKPGADPQSHIAPTFTLSHLLSPLLAIPFLAFLPVARALAVVPPHPAPHIARDPAPTTTPQFKGNYRPDEHDSSTYTDLPSDVQIVEETSLPFLLTQDVDGNWAKSERGWQLYGRQSGIPGSNNVVANDSGAGTDQFAIEASLPKGWGRESDRTSIYRVPLIAVASLILALVIVAGIIMYAFKRRKQHRRAKRRAERARRKALAAAGITESQVDGPIVSDALKAQLAEIEARYGIKTRKKGQSAFVRVKVKKWRNGVKRRKGRGGGDEDGDGGDATTFVIRDSDGAVGDKLVDLSQVQGNGNGAPNGVYSRPAGDSLSTASLSDSIRTHSQDGITPNTSPENDGTNTGTGTAAHSPDQSADQNCSSDTHGTSHATSQTPTLPNQEVHPYFPPAYRPASVRSYNMQDPTTSASPAGPSRAMSHPHPQAARGGGGGRRRFSLDLDTDEDDDMLLHGHEKVTAPGYYPAPATEESEAALAVVQRSDGKVGLHRPEEAEASGSAPPATDSNGIGERDRRIGHVATDDKQVLERLRLGGSAPPLAAAATISGSGFVGIPDDSRGASDGADGPSAPVLELDQDGFERLDLDHHVVGEAFDHRTPTATNAADPSITRQASSHPDLPEPPRRHQPRSLALSNGGEAAFSTYGRASDVLPGSGSRPDEAHLHHLLPSAPPTIGLGILSPDEESGPSAPPMDLDVDEPEHTGQEGTDGVVGRAGDVSAAASAPPLHEDADDGVSDEDPDNEDSTRHSDQIQS